MNKGLITLPLVMALVVAGSVQAAGDAAAGKTKAVACGACHGPDGNSPNPIWPKLAGQHPDYIQKQIGDFKSGARKDPLMSAQAALLPTDQDVADVAAYFSGQNQSAGVADPAKVNLGQQLYRGGNMASGVAACGGCHGPAGMGNPLAKFPRISGQHADYVSKALKDFRASGRANDPNGMMRGVALHMTDDEIAAVSQYVQGLTQ
jgi:cytochrome c553